MKKVGNFLIIFTGLTVWIGFLLYLFIHISSKTMLFTESSDAITNPSRGFYLQFDSGNVEGMSRLREKGMTLALLAYDIHDYTDIEISNEKLEELRAALETAQKNGIKVIFRAAYGFDSKYQFQDPESLDIIYGHIEQIAPIINEYKQSILCVQAGFLGPWGEWHSSNLIPEDQTVGTENRNAVLRSLMNSFDESIIFNVRTPVFVRDAVNAGLDVGRLGIHNDGLLSNDTDMGTYADTNYSRAQELEWMEQNLQNSIYGGEMPMLGDYSTVENAVAEFEKLNITYLNSDYNKEVLDDWKKSTMNGENAYEVISRHLGYRLSLTKVKLPTVMKENRKFEFEITIQNTGYAAIPEGYKAVLIIRNQEKIISYPLDWNLNEISGGTSAFYKGIVIPDEILDKTVQLGIAVCGTANELSTENYDSIILANDSLEYKNGVNYFAVYEPKRNRFKLVTAE